MALTRMDDPRRAHAADVDAPHPSTVGAIGDRVRLQTVGKGQEFILDMGQHQKGQDWLRGLIETHGI